ncbi:uncharacterized protein LOC122534645 [Frieseomelitta varia]|uniref:uncharacterized protein LOC122534645 n=1 Tax=Frieseomelitta varia TaxID=561572 RepID=UPI001CB68C1C|nr:uncharacterized protein LOC122534645 [Frieseomelitta varia]
MILYLIRGTELDIKESDVSSTWVTNSSKPDFTTYAGRLYALIRPIEDFGRGSQMRNVYQCVVLKRLPTEVYGEDSGAAATTWLLSHNCVFCVASAEGRGWQMIPRRKRRAEERREMKQGQRYRLAGDAVDVVVLSGETRA